MVIGNTTLGLILRSLHSIVQSTLQVFLLTTLLLLVSLLFSPSTMAAQESEVENWQLKRDKKGVQIFIGTVPGSKFKAIRSSSTLNGKLSSVVALVLDSKSCASWAAMCKLSERIEHASNTTTDYIIYTYNNLPFPVKDRDIVASISWNIDDTGMISMDSTALDGHRESLKRAIRIRTANASWRFKQLDPTTVQVESFAHVDPNGIVPAWIYNRLLVDSPFKTLNAMRKLVESGKYDDASVPFPIKQ